MRLHRFYIGKNIGDSLDFSVDSYELSNQLRKVFRYKTGDSVVLFDNSGFEYIANITDFEKDIVKFEIIEKCDKRGLIEKNVILFSSLVKKDTFEWIAEKATELGVSEIYPVVSERSEKKNINEERINKIVIEASEQSGRVTIPKINKIISLSEAVEFVKNNNIKAVAYHTVTTHQEESASYEAVFIGPEGGFTENEIKLFQDSNIGISSLGKLILRSETAVIVALSKLF